MIPIVRSTPPPLRFIISCAHAHKTGSYSKCGRWPSLSAARATCDGAPMVRYGNPPLNDTLQAVRNARIAQSFVHRLAYLFIYLVQRCRIESGAQVSGICLLLIFPRFSVSCSLVWLRSNFSPFQTRALLSECCNRPTTGRPSSARPKCRL